MTDARAGTVARVELPQPTKGQIIVKYLTTTDHKLIGNLYLITSFIFFLIGGLLAMVMRAELARPGLQFVDDETYNQLFTMHGTIMLLLFATPLFVGFANSHHAAADRRARRRVPAAQHVRLLAVPVRRPDRGRRLPDPGRGRGLRLVRLRAAVQLDPLTRRRRRPVDHGPVHGRSRHHPRRGQLHHDDHLHAGARHDDVPDADLHLEHPGDRRCWC